MKVYVLIGIEGVPYVGSFTEVLGVTLDLKVAQEWSLRETKNTMYDDFTYEEFEVDEIPIKEI